jgi:hypothetical protein
VPVPLATGVAPLVMPGGAVITVAPTRVGEEAIPLVRPPAAPPRTAAPSPQR